MKGGQNAYQRTATPMLARQKSRPGRMLRSDPVEELELLVVSVMSRVNARKYRTSPRTPQLPANPIRPKPMLPPARDSLLLNAVVVVVVPLPTLVEMLLRPERSWMAPTPPEMNGCQFASGPNGNAPIALTMYVFTAGLLPLSRNALGAEACSWKSGEKPARNSPPT